MIENFYQSIQIVSPQTHTIELIFKVIFYLSISISVIYCTKIFTKKNNTIIQEKIVSIMTVSAFLKLLNNIIDQLTEIRDKWKICQNINDNIALSNEEKRHLRKIVKLLDLFIKTVIEE